MENQSSYDQSAPRRKRLMRVAPVPCSKRRSCALQRSRHSFRPRSAMRKRRVRLVYANAFGLYWSVNVPGRQWTIFVPLLLERRLGRQAKTGPLPRKRTRYRIQPGIRRNPNLNKEIYSQLDFNEMLLAHPWRSLAFVIPAITIWMRAYVAASTLRENA